MARQPLRLKERKKTLVRTVAAESNFEEFPYFLVSSTNRGRQRQIVYERTIRHQAEDGERLLDQRWEVREGGSLGLPGGMDQDVYMALLELLEHRGGMPEDGDLAFSIYELLEVLGWAHSGRSYERSKRSLDRMASTTIRSDKAFFSKKTQTYIKDTFQMFSAHLREDQRLRGRAVERHRVKFHPLFVESYSEDYLNRLDSGFYWTLKHHASKRLYRLLDRYCEEDVRGRPRVWETDLFDLRDLVPLAEYPYASQIRQKLEPAHEELVDKGFLKDVTYVAEEGRRTPGLVFYETSPTFSRRRLTQRVEADPANAIAMQRLRIEGVRRDKAVNLVAEYGGQRCIRWAELLAFQKNVREDNKAGLLVWAIETEPLRWEKQAERHTEDRDSKKRKTRDDYGWLFGETEVERQESGAVEGVHGDRQMLGQDEPTLVESVPDDPEAEKVWRTLVEALLAEGVREVGSEWFYPYLGYSLEDCLLIVSAPDESAVREIIQRFGDDFQRLWCQCAGEGALIRVGVRAIGDEGGDRG